jgi:diguanylate cyclase (GGDEF)-like protein
MVRGLAMAAELKAFALKLDDEPGRQYALDRLTVLDTAPEPAFDKIVGLVRDVLGVPICAVSLLDHDRQWFKAKCGLDVQETGRPVSFCTHTITQAEPFIVNDALADPRFADNPLVTGEPFIRFYAGVPLRTPDGYNVGSLCVIDTVPRAISPRDMGLLEEFGRVVTDELELRQIASRDHLTGALSRRSWTERAKAEMARAHRYGRPLSLAMLDIDLFKKINDSYGHSAGDVVIKHIACLCMSMVRQSDLFGRFGGEEFVLMMPETGAIEARMVAERIRTTFGSAPTNLGEPVTCTISVGLTELAAPDDTLDTLIDHADEALYEAKDAGRNRTVLAQRNRRMAPLKTA